MDYDNNKEVLSLEESEELNDKLKEIEDINLPESLSPEKVEEMIKNVPQFIPGGSDKKKRKKGKKRILLKTLSVAAAIAVVFTSLSIV